MFDYNSPLFWLNVIGCALLVVILLSGFLAVYSIKKRIKQLERAWQERKEKLVQEFLEELHEESPEACTADGFDDCIIGSVGVFGEPTRVLYDQAKIITKLMTRDGMTEEEALEYFDFNIAGAYVEGVPAYANLIKFPTFAEMKNTLSKK